jgi:hypothetical protein
MSAAEEEELRRMLSVKAVREVARDAVRASDGPNLERKSAQVRIGDFAGRPPSARIIRTRALASSVVCVATARIRPHTRPRGSS